MSDSNLRVQSTQVFKKQTLEIFKETVIEQISFQEAPKFQVETVTLQETVPLVSHLPI
jgi:hypothetical protein